MTPRRHDAARGASSGVSGIAHRLSLLAALLALIIAPLAGDDQPKTDSKGKRPSLALRATPPISFSPARVVIIAELKGGAENDSTLYCPDLEWEWGDDTRSESKQNCDPFVEGQSKLTRRWTASHTYTTAGHYRAYLRLKRGDKVVVAGSTRFEVRPGAGDLSEYGR